MHCRTCDLWFDVAVWVGDARVLLGAMGPEGAALERPGAEGRAPLERYRRLIEASQEGWERCYAEEAGEEPPGVEALMPEFSPGRYPLLPAEVLAHARGLRRVVCRHPGVVPAGRFQVGPVRALLTLDPAQDGGWPESLHLSVSHLYIPKGLVALELHLMLALFFTPAERPFVTFEPGRAVPVVHCYLPAELSSLEEC